MKKKRDIIEIKMEKDFPIGSIWKRWDGKYSLVIGHGVCVDGKGNFRNEYGRAIEVSIADSHTFFEKGNKHEFSDRLIRKIEMEDIFQYIEDGKFPDGL